MKGNLVLSAGIALFATAWLACADVISFTIPQPVIIPDVGESTNTVSTPSAPAMASLNSIELTIAHEWLSDLTVTLVAPDASSYVLFSQVGSIMDSPSLGVYVPNPDTNNVSYVLLPVPYQFAATGADLTAAAQSALDLSALVVSTNQVYAAQSWPTGPLPAGIWQLVVVDSMDLSGGALSAAQLTYTSTTNSGSPASVTLNWPAPADIVYGTPLGSAQLAAVATANGATVPGTFAYTPTAGTVLSAGRAQALTVSFTPQDTNSFSPASTSVNLNVNPAPLQVAINNQTMTYGAAVPPLTCVMNGFVNGDTTNLLSRGLVVGTLAGPASPVGTYPITAAVGTVPNYTISLLPGTLTVLPSALTVTADNKTRAYGSANPVFTATYTGFLNGDTPSSLTQPVSFSTTATTNSPPGAYPITVTGGASPNYSLVLKNGMLTVTKGQVLVITADSKSKVYGFPVPPLTVSYSGFINGDTPASLSQPVTLSTTATSSSPPGTYPITVTGGASSNYVLALNNGTLTITPAPLTVTADNKTMAYGDVVPTLTASYSGFVNGDTVASLSQPVTLSTTAIATSPPGSYPIVLSGGASPNYTLTLNNGSLIVAKARLLAITADNQSMVYGGALPKLTVSYSGFVNGDTPASLTQPVTVSTTANSSSPPGTYPIVVSGGASSYYSLSLSNGTLTVTKAPLTVTADNKSREYGGSVPALTVSYSGFLNGDTPSSLTQPVVPITSASTNSPPGTYPITLTGGASAKYSLALNSGVLTVSPAPLAITADTKSVTYGDPIPTLTASYSGFMNGDTPANLTQPVTLSTTATSASPPGSYPIVVTGGASSNYSLILNNGTLTISKTRLLNVTAANQTMVYGGTVPQLTVSYSGFINGDTPANLTQPVSASTTASSKSPPGTYPIILSGGASSAYSLNLNNGTLTITQAVLTVTADNKTKVYGSAVPALTAHYSGFVNGDTASSFTKPVTLTTTASASSPAGSYPVIPSGGVSSNYALVYQNGVLTVAKAVLTVTANDKIKAYGADLPALTASYSGLVGSDTPSSLSQPVVLSTTATASSPVGTYPITAVGGSSPNYTLVLSNGTLTVRRALLTVTVDNQTKLYGAPLPQLTATYTGFALGDTAASLAQPVTLTSTATPSSPVGVYQIAANGGASPNYNLVLNNGALTIAPAPLTIKADDKTKIYGAPLPLLTASYSGFVNGDSPARLIQQPSLSTTATATSPSGKYPVVVSGAQAANYAISYLNGTLTVVQELKAPEFLPGALRVRADGSLSITVLTAGTDTVRLETSEDLMNWVQAGTQTATNRQAQFKLNNSTAAPQRFFRAVLAP